MASGRIRIGTSSFSETDWVGPFYPPGTRPRDFFKFYATQFSTVEIDASYYAIPTIRTVERWCQLAPSEFIVGAKFPREIVHGGEAATPDGSTVLDPDRTYPVRDKFLSVMERLGTRLGVLVLQFPYFNRSIFPEPEAFLNRLDRFLNDLPRQFRYAVEIRNPKWLTADFADLLRRYDVALVLVDQEWMPPIAEVTQRFDPFTTDFAYVRLLGERKRIEAITTTWEKEVIDRTDSLEIWSTFLTKSLSVNTNAYIYVNNHFSGHAPSTARKLEALIQEKLSL